VPLGFHAFLVHPQRTMLAITVQYGAERQLQRPLNRTEQLYLIVKRILCFWWQTCMNGGLDEPDS